MKVFINHNKSIQIQIGHTQTGVAPKSIYTPIYLPLEACNYVTVVLCQEGEDVAFELTTQQGKVGYVSLDVFWKLLQRKELLFSFREEAEFVFMEDLETTIQTGSYGSGWNAGIITEKVCIPKASVFKVTEMNGWPDEEFRGQMDAPNGSKTVQDIIYFCRLFFLKLILNKAVAPKEPISEDTTRVFCAKDLVTNENINGGLNPIHADLKHFSAGEVVTIEFDAKSGNKEFIRTKDNRMFFLDNYREYFRYVLK